MGESMIRRVIKDTDGDAYEAMRALNQSLTFEAATREFQLRNIPFASEQFKTLRIVNEDGIYTNLGLLISDQCMHTIKLAVFQGKEKTTFKDRVEFDGSLFKQLNDCFSYLSRYNRVSSEMVGLYREDKKDYPQEALREALINALVHRDYAYSASTLISLFDDRIEMVSVGGLAEGLNLPDIMLGISITKNDRLASLFYRLMLIEAYGTGVPRIFDSYKKERVKPRIEISDNAFKITLPNRNEPGIDTQLNRSEKAIVELLRQEGRVKRKEIEKQLGISQSMAGRIVRDMVDKEILDVRGQGKNTEYLLKD